MPRAPSRTSRRGCTEVSGRGWRTSRISHGPLSSLPAAARSCLPPARFPVPGSATLQSDALNLCEPPYGDFSIQLDPQKPIPSVLRASPICTARKNSFVGQTTLEKGLIKPSFGLFQRKNSSGEHARYSDPQNPTLCPQSRFRKAEGHGNRNGYCASRHVKPLTMLSIVVRETPCLLANHAREVPGI